MAKKENTLNQEMIDQINKYGSEIETNENFMEVVRDQVGHYLGYRGNKGFINMIREVFQNAIDEMMKNASPCTRVGLHYNENTKWVKVIDNGRGIPFDDIERVFAKQYTSSNYTKKPGEFSSGRHGVGAKVTNAVCSDFVVESCILGKCKKVYFKDFKIVSEEMIEPSPIYQGTIVSFVPHFETMGEITTTVEDVMGLAKLLLPLIKIGGIIDFEGVKGSANIKETFVNEDGIITDLINKTINPLIKPIVMFQLTDDMKAEIAFTYDSSDLMTENITSFSNFCPTIGGTHVSGFIDGLTEYFRKYMNRIYLASVSKKKTKNQLVVVNNDIKIGLKCIINVAHIHPDFSGQAKEILGNPDMGVFVKKLVIDSLDDWAKKNPSDLNKLCGYYKGVAELRAKSDQDKIKITAKYETGFTGLPKNYIKPSGKDGLELIIVEGDSAKGSYRNVRNPETQGLYPIRGKIINAFSNSLQKVFLNEEALAIFTLCGGTNKEYGKKYNADKCPFERIIFASDADVDGKHIRTLLIKLFLVLMPSLVTSGKIYFAVPPLYGLPTKKGWRYFTDKSDYVKYVQESFSKRYQLKYANGSIIQENDITKILCDNSEFIEKFEKISNTFSINPLLLEFILTNRNKSIEFLKKEISNKYRFIKKADIVKSNNVTCIKGLVNKEVQTIFLEKILYKCDDIIGYIDNSLNSFIVNDSQVVTLYGLMKLFEKFKPDHILRFKGLGEMNSDQLADSTLYPNPNRILVQYNTENIDKEIEQMRILETDKQVLLKSIIG